MYFNLPIFYEKKSYVTMEDKINASIKISKANKLL